MKRWPLRILMCLLLGVVTTVGVAWGLGRESMRRGAGRRERASKQRAAYCLKERCPIRSERFFR